MRADRIAAPSGTKRARASRRRAVIRTSVRSRLGRAYGVTRRGIRATLLCSNALAGHHNRGSTNAPLTVLTARWLAEAAQKECFSLLTYQDKTLTCVDCGMEFSFTASDQQFYADRQFSEPRRCPACRAAKKAARGESTGSYSSGDGYAGGGYRDRPR